MQTDDGIVTTGEFLEADNSIASARFWTTFLAEKTCSFGRLPCISFGYVFETL